MKKLTSFWDSRASISIKITYFLFYRKIVLASVINADGCERYLADVLPYLSDTVLTSLFCLSVAIKDSL